MGYGNPGGKKRVTSELLQQRATLRRDRPSYSQGRLRKMRSEATLCPRFPHAGREFLVPVSSLIDRFKRDRKCSRRPIAPTRLPLIAPQFLVRYIENDLICSAR
jgi:hypothetical protein